MESSVPTTPGSVPTTPGTVPTAPGIVLTALAPHPPIIVPEIGRGELERVKQTCAAMEHLAARLREARPDALVMISPHAPVFRDAVALFRLPELSGDFGRFGAPRVRFSLKGDPALAGAIAGAATRRGIKILGVDEEVAGRYGLEAELDHGLMVPLYYFRRGGLDIPLVAAAMGMLPPERLYSFGIAVREAAAGLNRRVALVASGDLSHRLTPDAPAGYNPQGKEFDTALVNALKQGDLRKVFELPSEMCEAAGECGLRPLQMMLGALEGYQVRTEVLSYEGPFGVGYCVATFTPEGPAPGREMLPVLTEDPFVALARRTIEDYVRQGRVIDPPDPLPKGMEGRAGTFVSIKKHGDLRGCIGTIGPTRGNIAEEIIHNGISAATGDPRFEPVEPEELDDLTISVDVLGEPEPIKGLGELDPRRYGVIVTKGFRRGLLLPNLEGIDTPEEQVAIARRKAGIGPDERGVELERFEVVRHT